MFRTRILGTGSYLPERVITNDDLSELVETNDEWIRTRTGIQQRRGVADGEACSDLALAAGQRAIEMAGIDPKQLDMIIVGTVSGDYPFPATAVLLARALGLNCSAFDISAACSGFLHALAIADGAICSGRAKHCLVIGAEALTTIVNWRDRTTCILFGDGAGAVVVGPTDADDPRGLNRIFMHSNGELAEDLYIPQGGSRTPLTAEGLAEGKNKVAMAGNTIFKHASRNLASVSVEALEAARWTADEVDHVIAHQANTRILDQVLKRLSVPSDKLFVNMDMYGNTSAASLPIALDEVNRLGRLKKGDKLLMMALGGGIVWAGGTCVW
ncbi:MAG TPA: 3-oxoacyl-ACP synthase [Myxococcales bacterium]|nr:3-oxoacyl-ACP synthase [Myxococcales bacterium]HBU48783.1 3-oxoacyl-ACP synthase [Myxococcales bacterium]